MTRRKFTPSQTKKEAVASLADAPARDSAALILPIVSIKITAPNDRSDLPNIDELAASIKEHGVLQPLAVVRTGQDFELVAGRRRLAAAQAAGLDAVPVRVLDVQGDGVAVVRLIENIQREQLTGADEIKAVAGLLSAFGGNQSELARALSRSQSYVNRCCRAAKAIEGNAYATSHSLTKSVLFELADAQDPESLLEAIKTGGAKTVQDAREQTTSAKPPRQPSGPLPGGRPISQALRYRERRNGAAFSLRINFDERTASETKFAIVSRLEEVLSRLKGQL